MEKDGKMDQIGILGPQWGALSDDPSRPFSRRSSATLRCHDNGYWYARELQYIMSGTYHILETIRIIGDMIFIILGVFPITYAIIKMHLSSKGSAFAGK